MTWDVCVVGAGPVGLCVALGLARRKRRVVVLEKNATTSEHSRAPAVWPRSQEILHEMGVLDPLVAAGLLVEEVTLHDVDRGGDLLRLPLTELADATRFARLLVLPQSKTEQLLCEQLRGLDSAEVRFGSEVVGVTEVDGEVEVACRERDEPLRARFVVGADGAHSCVREAIGGHLAGKTYGVEAALVDVEVAGSSEWPWPRLSSREGLAIALRMTDRLWRIIMPLTPGEELDDARIAATVAALFGGCSFTQVWRSRFRLHRRVSTVMRRGRVVLAGDAAHLNSPVGGQGMNAGIQDAASLVDALDCALAGQGVDVLDRYVDERLARIEGVNRFTGALTRVLLANQGRMVRPALRTLALALRSRPLRRRVLRRLAMLEP